jgi:hypothetical protein
MTREEFAANIKPITDAISGRALDAQLQSYLNETFGPQSAEFEAIRTSCAEAIDEGWMCKHEQGGIRFGRVLKPSDELAGFSVDVVHMDDVVGPHHSHPNGEIDMVMPLKDGAKFDGQSDGWVVYGPGSAHSPTVKGGAAWVLYLLPGGAIEFSRAG